MHNCVYCGCLHCVVALLWHGSACTLCTGALCLAAILTLKPAAGCLTRVLLGVVRNFDFQNRFDFQSPRYRREIVRSVTVRVEGRSAGSPSSRPLIKSIELSFYGIHDGQSFSRGDDDLPLSSRFQVDIGQMVTAVQLSSMLVVLRIEPGRSET